MVFVSAVNGVSTLAGTSDNIADGIARIFGDEGKAQLDDPPSITPPSTTTLHLSSFM